MMAHQYSVEIHTFLSAKLKEVEERLSAAGSSNDEELIHYEKGRLDLLLQMRKLISERFDLATQKYY